MIDQRDIEGLMHHAHRGDTCPMRDRIDSIRDLAMHRNEEMEHQLHDVVGRMEAMNAALTHNLHQQEGRLQQIATVQAELRTAAIQMGRIDPELQTIKRKVTIAEGAMMLGLLGMGLVGWFTSRTFDTLDRHSAAIIRIQEQHSMMMHRIEDYADRFEGIHSQIGAHISNDSQRWKALATARTEPTEGGQANARQD